MTEIGIMGGSFDPIHVGHLIVANTVRQQAALDEVWLMVSPENPLKQGGVRTPAEQRLAMAALATAPLFPQLKACDVELSMPTPSYTIDTLHRLRELYPHHRFRLIIGSDNWLNFSRWRAGDEILRDFGLIIYPRPGYPVDAANLPEGASMVDAPQIELSSTMIRRWVADGRDITWLTPDPVVEYINNNSLYTHGVKHS